MNPEIKQGPLLERGMLSAGLDYYKPTMSQLAYKYEPGADVTFTLKNRGEQRLADCVDPEELQKRLDCIRKAGFRDDELGFLQTIEDTSGEPVFGLRYLTYLTRNELPEVVVDMDESTDDIQVQTTGKFPLVTFWETVVMSEINEMYFENYARAHGVDLFELYDEGNRRLSRKIELLKEHPGVKFTDFGTRRHFSLRWQKHVLSRLREECPDNFIGTSNVGLAMTMGEKPIGTFAHEMPMVYAGLAMKRSEDIRMSHNDFLSDWYDMYGPDLSIALTDTFGSEFFFEDFSDEQARNWRGLRHDSGDPVDFGERAIAFYESKGIDPRSKTIVFSDGLDIDAIVSLYKHFGSRINVMFGWGTTLTNDLGIKPLNIVMKATAVNGQETVKLSDNEGKHTGSYDLINRYKQIFSVATAGARLQGAAL